MSGESRLEHDMRLGRTYTNFLVYDYLSDDEKRMVASGKIDLASMSAIALKKAKTDVERKIKLTREIGFSHVELDADAPSPYLEFDAQRKQAVRDSAKSHDVTLSIHLPYSYISGSTCCPQEADRAIAVELHKRYIEFASGIGAKYLVMHPGSMPPYQTIGRHRNRAREALTKSLVELGKLASDRGLALHLENNTAPWGIFTELEECTSIVREARELGADVYFNFDIGHWLTRAEVGKPIPDPPESVLEPLPPDMLKELHLNDYLLDEHKYHPPLHLELGFLKRGNFERYARLVKRKKVEVVVLETALQDVEQVLDRERILAGESKYIREAFGF
jgi:sugar phosphate isomerase/epimerase